MQWVIHQLNVLFIYLHSLLLLIYNWDIYSICVSRDLFIHLHVFWSYRCIELPLFGSLCINSWEVPVFARAFPRENPLGFPHWITLPGTAPLTLFLWSIFLDDWWHQSTDHNTQKGLGWGATFSKILRSVNHELGSAMYFEPYLHWSEVWAGKNAWRVRPSTCCITKWAWWEKWPWNLMGQTGPVFWRKGNWTSCRSSFMLVVRSLVFALNWTGNKRKRKRVAKKTKQFLLFVNEKIFVNKSRKFKIILTVFDCLRDLACAPFTRLWLRRAFCLRQ